MSRDIYHQRILDHYKNPRNTGKPDNPDEYEVQELENTSCGDTIELYLKIEDGNITDVKYEVEACAISTASASILSQYLQGKEKDIVEELDQEKMSDEIIEIEVTPMRLKCVLLPRDAVREVISENKN